MLRVPQVQDSAARMKFKRFRTFRERFCWVRRDSIYPAGVDSHGQIVFLAAEAASEKVAT